MTLAAATAEMGGLRAHDGALLELTGSPGVEELRRAAEADPAEPEPARAVARTLSRMGRASDAEAAWEVHLVEHPWDVEAALALTDLRLSKNRLDDRTVELAERAVLFLGGPTAQDRLIEIHHSRGESARAQALEVARRERRPLAPLHVTPIEGAGGGGS